MPGPGDGGDLGAGGGGELDLDPADSAVGAGDQDTAAEQVTGEPERAQGGQAGQRQGGGLLGAYFGADGILRVGTSQGLGERLGRVLEELRATAPGLQVRLVSAPAAERVARVRAGELDAAFVRAVTSAPGLELLPMWPEPLTVALPATHPLAAQQAIQLAQLSGIPLRLAPRPDNPPFHDLILGACADAGFEPPPGPPFTTAQDVLAEIGTGPPTWTVFYAAADLMPVRQVAFRPLAGLTAQTCLAVLPGPPAPALRRLLDACAAANSANPPTEPSTG